MKKSFLKKIHAPSGYTFVKNDDFKKLKITALTIKKIEADNNCSIVEIAKNQKDKKELEAKYKKDLDLVYEKYKNEVYNIQVQASKVIENLKIQLRKNMMKKSMNYNVSLTSKQII